jgi:argininosuccinate lyase
MVGRTHMQPAMPSSVGLWASAVAEGLLDDLATVMHVYDLNDQCPLGSAAGYGVPLPIDREAVAELLGFSRVCHNVLYAGNARGKLEGQILFALGQIMLTLSRLAQDLILYAMPEFGYFRLPPEYGTGSSIMPQKNNPDVLELIRARAARVLGAAGTVTEMVRASPSGYNRDLQEAKGPFLEGLATTAGSLRVLTGLAGSLEVRPAALRRGFTPEVFATDYALERVAAGVPFRDAYQEVKANLAGLAGRDPVQAIRQKDHLGGPAGLDFEGYRERTVAAAGFVQEERAGFHRAVGKLLGTDYPSLTGKSARR